MSAVLIEAYLEDLRRRRCSASTLSNALTTLPRFFVHLGHQGVGDIRTLSEAHVVGFARHLATARTRRDAPLAVGTQAQYLAVVKAFCGFLERTRRLLQDPAKAVPLPVRRRLPRALSQRDALRLMAAPDPWTIFGRRDRALLELLYGTGLRMSECCRLDLMDVDLAQGVLLIRNGKGRKDRLLPLPGRARAALELYLQGSRPELVRTSHAPAVFLSRYGRRLSGVALRLIVRSHGRAIGVKASCHVLRHSCATHLLAGGANVREIQRLLGHRHLTTTALYTKVDVGALAAMIRRCHPRERR